MTLFDITPDASAAARILQVVDIGHADAKSLKSLVLASRADALLLDLGDCHGDGAAAARTAVRSLAALLNGNADFDHRAVLIGLHALSDLEEIALDITTAAVIGAVGVALRSARSGADVQQLDVMLQVAEAEHGIAAGTLSILALAGDNPAGLLAAGSFANRSDRLAAIGWHGGRLAAALSADTTGAFSMGPSARDLTRLAAAAAGVPAVDWLDPTQREQPPGSARTAAVRDGFGWIMVEGVPTRA